MTQEEKILFIKVLAEQSPYGLKVRKANTNRRTVSGVDAVNGVVHFENDTISPFGLDIEHPLTFRQQVKPYLRPMSSMTKEEMRSIPKPFKVQPNGRISSFDIDFALETDIRDIIEITDWLNAHHFDWRGLIGRGLALKADEGLYKKTKKRK